MSQQSICNGSSCWINEYDVVVTDAGDGVVDFALTDGCNQLTTSRQIKMVLGKAINNWIAANRVALDDEGFSSLLGSCDDVGCDCGVGFNTVNWFFGTKSAQIDFGASLPAGVVVDVTVVADQPFARVN